MSDAHLEPHVCRIDPETAPRSRASWQESAPDGFVCANDFTAAQLLKTLNGLGVSVPGDVRMAGVDDVKYASLLSVPLTTIHQPCADIGAVAIATMLDRLRHPKMPPRDVLAELPPGRAGFLRIAPPLTSDSEGCYCSAPQLDSTALDYLYLQDPALRRRRSAHACWSSARCCGIAFPDATRLGGAALNFAVHLKRLRHAPLLVSAVGADPRWARRRAGHHGARTRHDVAAVDRPVPDGPRDGAARARATRRRFTIERPAAYDAVELSDAGLRQIVQWNPAWLYYGTLFPSCARARHV